MENDSKKKVFYALNHSTIHSAERRWKMASIVKKDCSEPNINRGKINIKHKFLVPRKPPQHRICFVKSQQTAENEREI